MNQYPDNPGGEKEGLPVLVLRPAELAVMRRMADKYPIVPGERKEVVDAVMNTLRATDKPRTRLACAKVMIAMDHVNHQELRTYLEFAKNREEPQQIVINNENKVVVSIGDKEKFLARAKEYADAEAVVETDKIDSIGADPHVNGNGKHLNGNGKPHL
jgi:hypothetical protein